MSEIFRSDADYELIIHEGWDRDGELEIEMRTDHNPNSYSVYLSHAEIKRLVSVLKIQLGDQ